MAIYYKFKNEKDFGKITLSGGSMQVLALKEAIAVKKNMSMDGMDFDLVIQDVKTKEGVARPSLVVRAFARFFHVRGAWLWGRAGHTGRLATATGVNNLPPDRCGPVCCGRWATVIINKSARLSPMPSNFCKTHCVWVGSGSIVVGSPESRPTYTHPPRSHPGRVVLGVCLPPTPLPAVRSSSWGGAVGAGRARGGVCVCVCVLCRNERASACVVRGGRFYTVVFSTCVNEVACTSLASCNATRPQCSRPSSPPDRFTLAQTHATHTHTCTHTYAAHTRGRLPVCS